MKAVHREVVVKIGGILEVGCEESGNANDARQGVSTGVFVEAVAVAATKLGRVCRAARSEVRMR
jgi:hypothetical protein